MDLEEREALLAEAERITGTGSWFWDVATNQVRWSRQLFYILGYPLDTVPTADAFFARIHPEDLATIREQSERAAAGGDPHPATCRLLLPGGVVRYVSLTGAAVHAADGSLRRLVGTLRDVTEAHRVQTELEETTSQLLDAQRLAHLGSWRWTFAEDHFTWSEETYRLLAWPADKPPTVRGLIALASREDRKLMERVLDLTRRGETAPPFDVTLTCHDKVVRHFESSTRPLRDERGRVVGAWGTLLDITERKKLYDQLLHAQKLEVVGQLAGGIAHDFNNLLTVIMLVAEVIAKTTQHPATTEILNAAARAKDLTNRLLAFGRQGVTQPRLVDLVQSSEATITLLERILGEHLRLRCELSTEPVPVVIDDTQFHQVLMNLLVNARDAMPSGGEIRVAVTKRHVAAGEFPAAEPALVAGDYAVVEVEDQGGGMDAETRARAFEPFFTTKSVGVGSGLGLATVRSIVTHAHGSIELTSEVGVGTRFRVFLPLSTLAPARGRAVARETRAAGQGHILLIEDEAMVAGAVRSTLESAGFVVTGHNSPVEALASSVPTRAYDLVITDLVMPEMSGTELVRELRARGPLPRVLYTTGYAPEVLLRSLDEDAVVLTKPFGSDALLDAVERLLGPPSK